ncbi:MAG: hypothetical protein JNK12_14865 [Acidimicrobiales bacterium]|nr:hypothetical protein [Acidimicrobiales bacterium]
MRATRSLMIVMGLVAGSMAPVVVASPAGAGGVGLSGVSQVAANASMTCAVLQDTTARCWGMGPLGTGGAFNQTSTLAVQVQDANGDPLTGVTQVAVGTGFACALLQDTSAVCWGENLVGNLGDGTTTPSARPVVVQQQGGATLTGITQLALGDFHACARLSSGEARCWGQNQGTIGDGTRTNRKRAVVVQNGAGTGPLTNVTQLAAGSNHTCALLGDGTVRCFGENGQGQIGDGTTTARLLPKLVKATSGTGSLTGVTQISSRLQTTCARLGGTGQLRCWGPNTNGQRGNGTVTLPGQAGPLRPTAVKAPSGTAAFTGAQSVGVGAFHACARVTTAQLRCWGLNRDGQAGDGTRTSPRKLPVVVRNQFDTQPLSNAQTVVGADQHTCALLTDSTVQCWGANNFGQVGDGTTTRRKLPTPVQAA